MITPPTPLQVNHEEQLKDMFLDPHQSPCLLCLGQKGGGKSFRVVTLLMWLLRNDVFDQYLLVTFLYEAINSYAWLRPFEDRVFVVHEYTPDISASFLKRPDETVEPHRIPRTFLWLDDVGMNEAFRTDRHFVGLLSVARHKRLSICLCFHSLTSGHTLSPFLRQNITHTLLFRVTNEKLLESIYEELISMTGHFQRFREFKQVYNQHTCSQIHPATGEVTKNFNGICINNAVGCLDWNVGDWFPEETLVLKGFLEGVKEEMKAQRLPAPKPNNNLRTVDAEMVDNIRGATRQVRQHASTEQHPPQNWARLRHAALHDPRAFLINPQTLTSHQKRQWHSYQARKRRQQTQAGPTHRPPGDR